MNLRWWLKPESMLCQVKACKTTAKYRITYDCADTDNQIIKICDKHFNSYDEIDGKKTYYFQKFIKEKIDLI